MRAKKIKLARVARDAFTRLMGLSEYEFGVYLNGGALFPLFICLFLQDFNGLPDLDFSIAGYVDSTRNS